MTVSSLALVKSVDSVSLIIKKNEATSKQMATSSNTVTRAIENIAGISEENTAAVEEVSAGTELMRSQVEDVANSATSLAKLALALHQTVGRFKLN
jgi:methyl-accepting chemotaxis protein